ncbi:MAG: inositol-3-phosphate synthase [Acidilobaceae archaeon]|nr:inositol-3-phosphate synthase [Acidilobaceae archaeon]
MGLIGVGNIAAMLVQGVELYKQLGSSEGLMHERIGRYEVSHIRFTYAVDVSREKVGKDLSEAIFAYPNMVRKIAPVPRGVTVRMGKVLDGVAPHMTEDFRPAKLPEPTVEELAKEMEDQGVDVLVNLLPVGSEEATRFYAEAAARAGAAFVNAIPVFVASKGFSSPAPVLGDDIKGQLGATAVHRALASLVRWRGVRLLETYQLNVGGNTDFKNMLALERLASKKESKTMAVASTQERPEELVREEKIYAGPSGYVPFLGNTKISHIYLKALAFAGSEVEIEVRLRVDDKAMASAVLVDVIRVAKVAKDHGLRGSIDWASAFYFKYPPRQARSELEALRMLYKGLEKLGEEARPRLDEPF